MHRSVGTTHTKCNIIQWREGIEFGRAGYVESWLPFGENTYVVVIGCVILHNEAVTKTVGQREDN